MTKQLPAVRWSLAAILVLLTGIAATPSQAQVSMTDPDAPVACSAFQRHGYGAWTAVAPTLLDYDNGTTLAISPGETFAPNQTIGGIEVTSTLDRHCGNM